VPPRSLFPESKEVHGLDYRKQLITVPSCDEHNQRKTKDDEFLMICLAGIVGNNNLALHHFRTKVNRALRRKSKDFLKKAISRNQQDLTIRNEKGIAYSVNVGSPDYPRLVNCFESIIYGLYYHEYNHPFEGEIRMLMSFIKYQDENTNTHLALIKKMYSEEKLALEVKGANPEVFKYQFCSPDEFGIIGVKLTFYSGTKIYAGLLPKGLPKPYDLTHQLIQNGFYTIIKHGDKEFIYNKDAHSKK
jgi:hypothetical protein